MSQSQLHEWKSMFLESGERGIRNGGGTDREHDLKNHLRVLEGKNSNSSRQTWRPGAGRNLLAEFSSMAMMSSQ